MEFNINYAFCYHTTNCNVTAMFWKTYGHGLWYDTRKETYEQALERIKEIIWNNIYAEFPHLKGTEINYTESELSTIQDKEDIDEKPLPLTTISDDINSATTLKELESFIFIAKQNVELNEVYQTKLKSLK